MTQQPVPLRIVIASLVILISGAVIVIAKARWAQDFRSYIATNGPPALHKMMDEAHRMHVAQKIAELVQDIRRHPP